MKISRKSRRRNRFQVSISKFRKAQERTDEVFVEISLKIREEEEEEGRRG